MNIERLAGILRDAAKAEIMPRFRRLDAGMVRTKTSAFDLVTEADIASERFITRAIQAANPDTVVIGEEAVSDDPRLLERRFEDETVIYVDPVDGTANFAAGLPAFAVMAGVVRRGETVAGVIYDPMGDDWMMAERGCGTWQVFPDGRRQRLRFAAPVAIANMGGVVSSTFFAPEVRGTVLANLAKVHGFANYRCSGQEYRTGAAGHLHFLMYNKVMPWDHVAGTLMMAEAGAHVARLDGSAYRTDRSKGGGLLVAPDEESWQELRREVFTL